MQWNDDLEKRVLSDPWRVPLSPDRDIVGDLLEDLLKRAKGLKEIKTLQNDY